MTHNIRIIAVNEVQFNKLVAFRTSLPASIAVLVESIEIGYGGTIEIVYRKQLGLDHIPVLGPVDSIVQTDSGTWIYSDGSHYTFIPKSDNSLNFRFIKE